MVLFHQSSIILCTVKIYVMNATEGYCVVIFYEYVQITEEIVQKSIDVLVKVVESEGSALASTAMEALGHIGLHCLLPSINRNSSQGKMCFLALLIDVNCATHQLPLLCICLS